ncbi:MAG: hypothetical protein Kow0047_12580 [Anaerolineae bacterium]
MGTRLNIFVSAGPDLEIEREVIGRVVAELPIQRGCEIHRTPRAGEMRQPDLDAAAECDIFFLLMGADITAPVGVEYDVARRARRRIVALLRKGQSHTPAGSIFVRESRLEWDPFEDTDELEEKVRAALVDVLMEDPHRFGLSPEEWEALESLREKEAPAEEGEAIQRPGGAGGGGVILGPEDAARGGVPLPRRGQKGS